MQIELFTIPVLGGEELLAEMNTFLQAHRVTDVQKAVVESGGVNYWSFCITYLRQSSTDPKIPGTKKGKIDYREVLEERAFARFTELRKIRKQIAYVDATISIKNKYNQTIFEDLVSVKGGSINYEMAARDAYKKVSNKLGEYINTNIEL